MTPYAIKMQRRLAGVSLEDLGKLTGVSRYVTKGWENGTHIPSPEQLEIISNLKRLDSEYSEYKHCAFNQTLCWSCQRAANFNIMCSWAERFIPVKGWEAEPSVFKGAQGDETSYCVKSCPLFIPDRPRKEVEICLPR